MTADLYLTMLEDIILVDPLITVERESIGQIDVESNLALHQDLLHFQQDCSPPYDYLLALQW